MHMIAKPMIVATVWGNVRVNISCASMPMGIVVKTMFTLVFMRELRRQI